MSAEQAAARPLDRRAPHRGDQRREALLESLDHLLRETSLDAINVADITRRAGVTRSAFYFYFESKAMAAAALVEELYDAAFDATDLLAGAQGTPRSRVERTIRALFDACRRQQHVFHAALEARNSSPAVRRMWDEERLGFVPPIAEMIERERAAGTAPEGPDAADLATVLIELNDRAMERLSLGGPLPDERHIEALVTIWLRSIYGVVPDHLDAPDDLATRDDGSSR